MDIYIYISLFSQAEGSTFSSYSLSKLYNINTLHISYMQYIPCSYIYLHTSYKSEGLPYSTLSLICRPLAGRPVYLCWFGDRYMAHSMVSAILPCHIHYICLCTKAWLLYL